MMKPFYLDDDNINENINGEINNHKFKFQVNSLMKYVVTWIYSITMVKINFHVAYMWVGVFLTPTTICQMGQIVLWCPKNPNHPTLIINSAHLL